MSTTHVPPPPKDPAEIMRWESTRLRRRMLTGEWRSDLVRAVNIQLGKDRAEEIGTVDISSNVFATVCTQLAVTYDVAPIATHQDQAAAELMNRLLDHAGFAPIMQTVQRLTLGLREMLIDVEAVVADSSSDLPVELTLRMVYPDHVVAKPNPVRSYEPIMVEEAEWTMLDGVAQWVIETVSAEPDSPSHTVRAADGTVLEDLSESVIRNASNAPVLPYVLYHANHGPKLWDHCQWQELVDGTISIGVKRSAASHALVMAAWPQRYTIGLVLATDEKDGRAVVTADPTTILAYEQADDKNNGTAGAFPMGFDPETFQSALREAESQLASNSGIPTTDLIRGSGDPRSGFALLLSRDSKKEAARRYEPTFKRSDLRLLYTIACVVNHTLGNRVLPETGWGITYRALPMTEAERAERQRRIIELLDKGLISNIVATRLIADEELTVPQAIAQN